MERYDLGRLQTVLRSLNKEVHLQLVLIPAEQERVVVYDEDSVLVSIWFLPTLSHLTAGHGVKDLVFVVHGAGARGVGDFAHHTEDNREDRAFVELAGDFDFTAHLLDDQFANGEAEPTAGRIVLAVLFQIVEVDE